MLWSRPAHFVAAFWFSLGVLYVVPGPAHDLLRSETGPMLAPRSAVPAVADPVTPRSSPNLTSPKTPLPGSGGAAAIGVAVPSDVTPIEDVGHSLASWARDLRALKAGRRQHVRVLHYGDSQLDIDHITASLRALYQRRYGDGGLGFVPAAKPWRWFYQPGVVHRSSAGWRVHRLAGGTLPDGRLGLGLSATERSVGAGWVRVVYRTPASRVELTYLRQPAGGSVTLLIAGKPPRRVSTASPRFALGSLAIEGLGENKQVVQVSTRGRVRLLGLRFERLRGVTWEGLPMISARFHRLVHVNAALWKAELRHVAPSLVVYQFGANDALSYGGNIKVYELKVARVLRWRAEALPQASCLVIGPLDQLRRVKGRLTPRSSVSKVIAAQRAAARRQGCAFWDARQAMGGPGSLKGWMSRGFLRHDLVHLSRKGAREFVRLFDIALQGVLKQPASPALPASGT